MPDPRLMATLRLQARQRLFRKASAAAQANLKLVVGKRKATTNGSPDRAIFLGWLSSIGAGWVASTPPSSSAYGLGSPSARFPNATRLCFYLIDQVKRFAVRCVR